MCVIKEKKCDKIHYKLKKKRKRKEKKCESAGTGALGMGMRGRCQRHGEGSVTTDWIQNAFEREC